jgi:hypothetical protein
VTGQNGFADAVEAIGHCQDMLRIGGVLRLVEREEVRLPRGEPRDGATPRQLWRRAPIGGLDQRGPGVGHVPPAPRGSRRDRHDTRRHA